MSQVSPYQRLKTERGQHRQATAVLVAVVAGIFFAAFGLANPNLIPWMVKPEPPNHQTTVTEGQGSREIPDEPESEGVTDWTVRIAAVKQALPESETPEIVALSRRLDSIAHQLEGGELSTAAEEKIQQSLNMLRQQAGQLNHLSNRPPVNVERIDAAIASGAQSILMVEKTAIQQAQDEAERTIRSEKEPTIRNVRLELRDQQDQAANLRRQIAQVQREQAEFQAKAARAEALRREMSDVKRYLSPFTAPGYLQPKSDRNAWDVERTADAEPVSLTRLKRLGALEPTMEGLERLYIFGGGKNAVLNNSRPLGSFPQYWAQKLSKPEVLQAVKRAQQLLRDHGQAMVEEQLLAP